MASFLQDRGCSRLGPPFGCSCSLQRAPHSGTLAAAMDFLPDPVEVAAWIRKVGKLRPAKTIDAKLLFAIRIPGSVGPPPTQTMHFSDHLLQVLPAALQTCTRKSGRFWPAAVEYSWITAIELAIGSPI